MALEHTVAYGSVSSQGMRDENQDLTLTLKHPTGMLFGLFDGHGVGGQQAAAIAIKAFVGRLSKLSVITKEDLRGAFKYADESIPYHDAGTVATLAFITNTRIEIAWVGDCRAILVGKTLRTLTKEHRLTNPKELRRINALGVNAHTPQKVPYVRNKYGDGIMPTRTLGDYGFRSVGVIAEPECITCTPKSTDHLLLLLCDGVWERVSDDLLREATTGTDPQEVAKKLVQLALLNDSRDNVTVTAVAL